MKILRACVVQSGKIIEERRLRKREPLSIGRSPKNTFVIADPALPKTHELFCIKGSGYELVLTEGMRGKVSVDGSPNPVDFSSLKAQGLLKKRGDYYHLPLNDGHRGKVIIGEVTVIFQFVVPPPAPAKPQLPAAARGSILKSIDWPYAGALMAALLLEAPMIAYFEVAPKPQNLTLDTIDDRWANLIVPERKDEVKKPPPTKKGAGEGEKKQETAKKAEKPKEEDDDEAAVKARAARREGIRKNIASKGILAVLGTVGDASSGGAVADVFAEGGIGGDLDSAFEGIAGVGLATADSGRTKRGGGSGQAASIGGLATSGGGKVGLGGKQEQRVGSVKTEAPEVDGALDSAAIARVVRGRMRMVRDCYERELKRDPGLAGKIEIEFTIGEDGKVEEAYVSNNAMGSDAVGACIVGRIRRWRFPQPDGGSVTVNFPFIFTPSS